jgi:hypothetical protein
VNLSGVGVQAVDKVHICTKWLALSQCFMTYEPEKQITPQDQISSVIKDDVEKRSLTHLTLLEQFM